MNPDLARLFIAYRRGQISYDEYMKGVEALAAAQPAPQEPTGYTSPSAPPPEPTPAPTPAPVMSPNAVFLAREATARSEEGPSYGRPEPTSTRVVQAVRQSPATAQPAQQPQPQQSAPSGLMQLIRGDFREGADQRVMEAMRRQREESGVEGKAEGGATTKKSSRDDVLHKALEIIHHMLTRR